MAGRLNWKKIKNAKVYGRGSYLKPDGSYKLEVIRTYTIATRNKGDAFIVDFKVLESDIDSIPPGSNRNWYQSMRDEDIAFPAIKEFMLALFNVDQSDDREMKKFNKKLPIIMEKVSDEKWQHIAAEDHPLNGFTIACETSNKPTRDGNDFTRHDWSPWEGDDSDEEEAEDDDEYDDEEEDDDEDDEDDEDDD